MKIWRWLEKGTFVAGSLAVGFWLGSIVDRALFQDWQDWVFEQQLRGQPGGFGQFLAEEKQRIVSIVARSNHPHTAQPPARNSLPVRPSAPDRGLIGRLTIPRLQVSAIIREGVGENTLRTALGHIPGTALPGTPGNIGLAGHRDTLLRPLRKIHQNDLIRLESLTGTYIYRVEKTDIVSPRNVSVLRLRPQPELTLVTCYPFYYVGAAPKRFIVSARQISANARPSPLPHPRGRQPTEAGAIGGGV
jgi:sortase A